MFTFLNIISCLFCYYMYNEKNRLQRKVDFLEYEMIMITTHMHKSLLQPYAVIEYKDEYENEDKN